MSHPAVYVDHTCTDFVDPDFLDHLAEMGEAWNRHFPDADPTAPRQVIVAIEGQVCSVDAKLAPLQHALWTAGLLSTSVHAWSITAGPQAGAAMASVTFSQDDAAVLVALVLTGRADDELWNRAQAQSHFCEDHQDWDNAWVWSVEPMFVGRKVDWNMSVDMTMDDAIEVTARLIEASAS